MCDTGFDINRVFNTPEGLIPPSYNWNVDPYGNVGKAATALAGGALLGPAMGALGGLATNAANAVGLGGLVGPIGGVLSAGADAFLNNPNLFNGGSQQPMGGYTPMQPIPGTTNLTMGAANPTRAANLQPTVMAQSWSPNQPGGNDLVSYLKSNQMNNQPRQTWW